MSFKPEIFFFLLEALLKLPNNRRCSYVRKIYIYATFYENSEFELLHSIYQMSGVTVVLYISFRGIEFSKNSNAVFQLFA